MVGSSVISFSICRHAPAVPLVFQGAAQLFSLPKGKRLWSQGERSKQVFALRSGIVKHLRLEDNGEAITIGICYPGAVLGATESILGVAHSSMAETLTKCLFERCDGKAFRQRIRQDPDFSWHIHEVQGHESLNQIALLGSLACTTARHRLAHLLRETFRHWKWPVACPSTLRVRMPFTQKEAAQSIAVTPEHLNRLLKKTESASPFHWEKGVLVVEDLGKFRKWVFESA